MGRAGSADLPDGESGIFFPAGLDRPNHVEFSAENRLCAHLVSGKRGSSFVEEDAKIGFGRWIVWNAVGKEISSAQFIETREPRLRIERLLL